MSNMSKKQEVAEGEIWLRWIRSTVFQTATLGSNVHLTSALSAHSPANSHHNSFLECLRQSIAIPMARSDRSAQMTMAMKRSSIRVDSGRGLHARHVEPASVNGELFLWDWRSRCCAAMHRARREGLSSIGDLPSGEQ